MKKTLLLTGLAAMLMLSSCITTTKTARTIASSSSIKNATVADLRVTGERVTKTIQPSKAIQRGGLENVKQAVIQEALNDCQMADVLVEPEFVIEKKRTLFGSRILSITVSGRPAHYENFRTLHDSVWASPGFHGQPNVVYVTKAPKGSYEGYASYGEKSGLGAKQGKLFGSGKNSEPVVGNTGWHRSGFGGKFEAIGGWQKGKMEKGGSGESDRDGYAGALLTFGYNITSHWFLGAGTGFYWDFGDIDEGFIPIFGDVRFNFSGHRRSTWFIDWKIGSAVFARDKKRDEKPGLFVMPSVGYSFGGFDIALQWGTQQVGPKHGDDWRVDVSHVGLSLGLSF